MKENQLCASGPNYDREATREKFISTGRKFRPYCRIKDINPDTFTHFMNGSQLPVSGGKLEQKILAALQEDGLLVLKEKQARRKPGNRKPAEAA